MQKKTSNLLKLFSTFFKIGLFTFGGGFAMIPLIERELVDKYGWIKKDKFLDTISVTQTVPGAIAINLAIFLGYELLGFTGAVFAAVGVALPSFLIILIIAIFFEQFSSNQIIQKAFMGIRPAVVALIAYAGYKFSKKIDWSFFLVLFLILSLIGRTLLSINPIYIILAAALVGLIRYYISEKVTLKNSNKAKE